MKFSLLLFAVVLGFVACQSNKSVEKPWTNLKAENFQKAINGKQVGLYFLANGDLHAAITNYGGRIVSLVVPGKNGELADVVLGFVSIDGYLDAREVFHGALIGRVGNRIANGKFSIDGTAYTLPLNNGVNHLHGGPGGFHNVVWDVIAATDSTLNLSYLSPDGEMGYPGNLQVDVTYTLTSKNEVRIDYHATTDKSTPVNLTNHAFFNLTGEANGTINNHLLTIYGDYYTPVDSTLIPLGENVPVKGTPFDFRTAKPIGQDLVKQDENEQLQNGLGYDHNFVLNKEEAGKMTLAATVVEPYSGRQMEVFTEEPGLQFYGGNFMDGSDVGKYGKHFDYRESFALETQHFPDSPNQPQFSSIILNPGEQYQTTSIYRFRVKE
ncbi:aldose epimerase family protein [Mangrovibacterium lignilyticum]|uniref:aldose epimerase family protein n=1 Tax=Mangrovibacterium lignilyticum TaxID=2668052 RepID=UPI0013D31DE4|nr:aldose epimerase family protein [Mangrovibacterium lignilyticum]